MQVTLFIAGTDTEAGKTYVSCGLLQAFNKMGWSTLGIKPVASGCARSGGRLNNPDTRQLQQASSLQLPHEAVTPFAFEPPVSPNIAAMLDGRALTVTQINRKLRNTLACPAAARIIEGCGGWHTPLNDRETMADFVMANRFPVLLVVGIRLGCLNHSLLTVRSMLQEQANVVGWIANCVTPEMLRHKENIAYLQRCLPVPCAGVIGHGARPEDAIDLGTILNRLRRTE
ncbi:ATP-dependent dethiobiotin synthetase BioD 1 [Aquicella siphonis]|uniref:ATP-dependent dethiobiotin synthetase BioD n=1 Tax=Aquicella siphonis TaxID=254247 RepID=A0A5E4PJY8_9COXI|nr:dethiobiotin synthase [Aquicella siphonis]VVC76798.1 ATP-dependent dethiobiotin synthetase BioD 1 [Aquicella siphonis]